MSRVPIQRTFRALRNPNYRLFWFGQLLSQTGTWMQSVALAWLVLQLTDSSLALGTVTTVQFTPVLLLSLFGGVIADRVPKRRLLVITQSLMLLQAFALGVLTSTGTIQLVHVYILAAVLGTANALDAPTRQAFVVEMVGPEDVPNAIALNSTLFNTARLVGPALGGILIAAFGVAACFYLNGLSYLAVIGGLLLMRPERFFAAPRLRAGHPLVQLREGLSYAVRTPNIALVVLLVAVLGTFGYNFTVVLPLIAKYVLDAGPVGFGALTSAMAVGSLIAALATAYRAKATPQIVLVGAAGFSVLLLGVALSRAWIVTVPLLVGLGVFSITFSATANMRLQLVAPPHLRGRVMSIYTLLFMGSTPIGSLIIGTLAERGGVPLAVAIAAAMCGLGTIAGFLYARRTRDEQSESAELRVAPPERSHAHVRS